MPKPEFKCLVISDFNVDTFAAYLSNDDELPAVQTAVAPYGQVMPVLVTENGEYWDKDLDFAVIWTQPQTAICSFNSLFSYRKASVDEVLKEVDEYSSLLLKIKDRTKFAFIPTWVSSSYNRCFGMLDMKNGIGIANMLMRMNLRLADNLEKASNLHLLNCEKWTALAGQSAFNPKLWYMGKIPFGNEVFKEAVRDIKSALRASGGDSKKLIILDLDDTLWGGIVGEVGWENIRLGGHDHVGEAYVDFQAALKSLTNRGILLGIASKNEESVALEAIEKHPEMVLRLQDFAGWRVNWTDKAQNISDLVSDLNLGLESVVFIDDNPVERARIREALPQVFVPEWPEDRTLYKKALLSLSCFNSSSITEEDLGRTKMYVSERERINLRNSIGSLDQWLKSLSTRVTIEELDESNLQRATQLLNKTNQLNLSTRRMTESELAAWAREEGHRLWTFRLSDKFGDSGLTGIISLQIEKNCGRIVDFVLSCRVMGRKVEELMLYKAIKYAESAGLEEIQAKYIPTRSNKPCLEFWKKSGFDFNEPEDTFYWKISRDYPLPETIQVEAHTV
jgi:FkbH-like protein